MEEKEDEPLSDAVNEISVQYAENEDENQAVSSIQVAGYDDDVDDMELFQSIGSLSALIDSYGYVGDDGTTIIGDYPETLAKLDDMARVFAIAFNEVHQSGVDANEEQGTAFFVEKDGFT